MDPFKFLEVKNSLPYVSLKEGEIKIPYNIVDLIENIQNYAEYTDKEIKEIDFLEEKTQSSLSNILKFYPTIMKKCMEKVNEDYDKLKPYASKINENRKKIEKGLNTLHILQDICADSKQKFIEFYEIVNDSDRKISLLSLLKTINMKNINNKKKEDERQLFYKYTLEEKFPNMKDWSSVYRKIKNEKVEEKEVQQVEFKKSVTLKKSKQSVIQKYEVIETDLNKDNISLEKLSKQDILSREESRFNNGELNKQEEIIKKLQEENKTLLERVQKLEKQLAIKDKDIEEKEIVVVQDKITPLKSWNIYLMKSFSLQDSGTYAKCICFDIKMDLLIIGLKNGNIEVYQMNSWSYQFSLNQHSSSVKTLICLYNSKSIVSGDKDGKILKWDLTTQQPHKFDIDLPSSIKCIVSASNETNIYAASLNKVYCFDINTCQENPFLSFTLESNISKLLWINENNYIVVGLEVGKLIVYNTKQREIYFEFNIHSNKIKDLSICNLEKGINFVSYSKDKTFKIFDIQERKVCREFSVSDKTDYYAYKGLYCHDGKTVVTIHEDGKIILNNYFLPADQGKQKQKYYFSGDNKILCGSYLGDGSTFVFGNIVGNIDIFCCK